MSEHEITSKEITPEGMEILQSGSKDSKIGPNLNEMAMKAELLDWANGFIKASGDWRKSSFETKWQGYRRDSDARYDPQLKALKQDWQSTAFIPITPTHRETIQSNLFRTLLGPQPMLEVKPRGNIDAEDDQSLNVRDIVLREMEKQTPTTQGFKSEFNKVLDDSTTYGSGFCRIRFEERKEKRKIRLPMVDQQEMENTQEVIQQMLGEKVPGNFGEQIKEVTTFRGVIMEWLDIWRVYPDPNSTNIRGNTIGYQFETTVGEIKRLSDLGREKSGYFKESFDKLNKEESKGTKESGSEWEQERDADRDIGDFSIRRTEYARKVEAFEVFARLPKKWVFAGKDLKGDDPEELIAARVIFHERAVMTVEVSDAYDGEAQIYHMKYFPVNGQFYGRGIPEMLQDIQMVVNETVNQRIDNVSLTLNKMYAVLEDAIVSRGDLVNKPGGFIRLKSSKVPSGNISHAITPLETPPMGREAYADPHEMERYGQERTSANKVDFGTQGSGVVKDSNKTLGGQQLAKQASSDKFAYIGSLIEADFMIDVFRAYWRTSYQNITPEEIVQALGEERAEKFVLLTPEEVDMDYRYTPQGIFTSENKALRQAKLQSMLAQFGEQPWIDIEAIFDKIAKANDEDPESLKLSEEDMVTKMGADANMSEAGASLESGARAISSGNTEQQNPQDPQVPPQ